MDGLSEHAAPARMSARPRDTATAIGVLRQQFGDRLQTGEAIRQQHGHTLTWIPNQPPDAVIFVETAADVVDIIQVARRYRAPVIPFGAFRPILSARSGPPG